METLALIVEDYAAVIAALYDVQAGTWGVISEGAGHGDSFRNG